MGYKRVAVENIDYNCHRNYYCSKSCYFDLGTNCHFLWPVPIAVKTIALENQLCLIYSVGNCILSPAQVSECQFVYTLVPVHWQREALDS